MTIGRRDPSTCSTAEYLDGWQPNKYQLANTYNGVWDPNIRAWRFPDGSAGRYRGITFYLARDVSQQGNEGGEQLVLL